jgi:LysR family transcriptional regulator, hydrogen peroxide-inducible genes activator
MRDVSICFEKPRDRKVETIWSFIKLATSWVCNDLNFTRAAKRWNVPQRFLTRAIQLLEQEFGGYLFDRKRSSIELADLGKLVRPYLEEFWRTASTAEQIAKEYSAKTPKELNLAIMCTIAPKQLLQMLSRFRTNHPEVRMQLTDGEAGALVHEAMRTDWANERALPVNAHLAAN